MNDFYATLGVPPNAAIAEIKDRYRFLAHAYHPDKFSSDAHKRDADEAFKKINEAFQTLSNPSLRAAYDRQRASGPASEPRSPPPPRPSPEPPPRQAPRQEPPPPEPSSRTKRPGTFKYMVAAIFWSIIGGMLGSSGGPLGVLLGVGVGLWFGIWVCNREATPHATVPPPPPQPESGERSSPSPVLSAFLIITGGIGLVALMFKLASPSTTAPQKDDWGGIAVDPTSPKPAFDPSKPFEVVKEPPAKPATSQTTYPWGQFKDAPPQSAFDPATAKPSVPSYEELTGFEDLGAVLEPPAGFKMDARSKSPKAASSQTPVFDPATAKPFDPDAYLASKASPKLAPKRAQVPLPEIELQYVSGLAINDKQGFVSVRNNGDWTLASVDFVVMVWERRLGLPAMQQNFQYRAVRNNNDEGRPHSESRFTFSPFDSDSLGRGHKYVDRGITWKIVSAVGLKPE